MSQHPLFLANRPKLTDRRVEVLDKFTGERFAEVSLADAEILEAGIAAAAAAEAPMREIKPFERREILLHCADRFRKESGQLADILCSEAGKPIKDSHGEVGRLIETFEIAAEEAIRMGGEIQNLEISERSRGYFGMFRRFPIGACSFISPFNFPLNLAAHKIAPAIAAGCPFVLKPASLTPISALKVGEALAETSLPVGAFSILPCGRTEADAFTSDPRLKLLSFTGSPEVGWALKEKSGKKKVILELGGNAACVIEPDWHDLEGAVERLIVGAFYQSGQSCISVQRVFVHESIYSQVKDLLVARTRKLISGDPRSQNTFVGPMISENEARRLEEWITRAVGAGGTLLSGGERKGALLEATLLENVPSTCDLVCREAFGPVAVLSPYQDFEEALSLVNHGDFGLQAGIFTRDLFKMHRAWEVLEVGGVMIGEVPSWRVDHMPYGGVKDSGLGREGVRFAMEDMTEIRNLVIRTST